MNGQMAKATVKHMGANVALGGFMGAFDYSLRRKNGESVGSSTFNALMWNVIPGLLFAGKGGIAAQMAFGAIPEIPNIIAGLASGARQMDSHLRSSAMPFTNYGFTPTAGAIQSMQRGLDHLGKARGVSQAHAALAAQAFRR